MDYKTLLVHVPPGPEIASHVHGAAQVARMFEAHLSAVCTETFAPSRDPRLQHLDGLQLKPLREALERQTAAARASFEEATKGQSTDWRASLDDPDDTLLRHAAGADLIVAERLLPRQDPRRFAEPDDLILESGLPVLALPPHQSDLDARRIVVGWKPTREARRAISEALPLLRRAETVILFTVRRGEPSAEAIAELTDVATRLGRHGIATEIVVREATLAPVAEVLLEFAAARRAGLIVVGGYGHARLRQWVLGGVTRGLLETAWVPVLFSH